VITVSILWARKSVNLWMGGLVGYIVLVLSVVVLGAGFSFTQVMEGLLRNNSSLTAFLLRGQTIEGFLSMSGRTELWRGVYALVSDRPIFGYGYVASRSVLLKVLPWAGHAHNALAETLLDLGIVGTALIWFALGRTLLSSLFQISWAAASGEWQRASILGILLFLLCDSFVSRSFGGVPAYEVLLFFASVFAHESLQRATRSVVLQRQFSNGTLPVAGWQLARGDMAHES
jgi:O-antigen ligase